MKFVPKEPHDAASRSQIQALSKILKRISPNSDMAAYLFADDQPAALYVGFNNPSEQSPRFLNAELIESYGTVRLMSIVPVILQTLKDGATLMMDEFDASLHPAMTAGIIAAFHNDEINVNHAQLIINTHNLVHMNSSLFRRDEIHLIEPDWEKHTSELYTLADFKTNGKTGARKDGAYMRKYLREAFGAYPDVDMMDLLEEMLRDQNPDHSDGTSASTVVGA